ncbi:stage V sporulation protein SpoVM [Clostridium peptidivorans]
MMTKGDYMRIVTIKLPKIISNIIKWILRKK